MHTFYIFYNNNIVILLNHLYDLRVNTIYRNGQIKISIVNFTYVLFSLDVEKVQQTIDKNKKLIKLLYISNEKRILFVIQIRCNLKVSLSVQKYLRKTLTSCTNFIFLEKLPCLLSDSCLLYRV